MKLVCNKPKHITKAEVLTCGWAMRLRLTVPGLRNAFRGIEGGLRLQLTDAHPEAGQYGAAGAFGFAQYMTVYTSDDYRIVDIKADGDEAEIVYIRDEDLSKGVWHRDWEPVEFVDDLENI